MDEVLLEIRQTQMEAFSACVLEQFKRRMLRLLRSNWPEQTKGTSDGDLLEFVREGMEKAAGYEILNETEVERFLLWMLPHGLQVERLPSLAWTVRILRNKDLSAPEKINELENSQTVFASQNP